MSAKLKEPGYPLEELIHQLDMRRAPEDQHRYLVHWLDRSNPDDLRLSLALLLQRPLGARVSVPALKKVLFERINKDLFDASKEAGSDLSETLALLWPGGTSDFKLGTLAQALQAPSPATRLKGVVDLLDTADTAARELIVRICTGRFKSPVDADVLRAALSESFEKAIRVIEQNLTNSGTDLAPFTRWLQGSHFPENLIVDHGFISVQPFKSIDIKALGPGEKLIAVPRGTCLELVTHETGSCFYTRSGDALDKGESKTGLPPGLSLLVFRPIDESRPLLLLDLLMQQGKDQSAHSYQERLDCLEDLVARGSRALPEGIELARPDPLGDRSPFDDPTSDRLLLPGTPWGEIVRPPHNLTLVVLYAEGPLTRKGHFTGDLTLGAEAAASRGTNTRHLVPVGKAPASDLCEDDMALLEAYIAQNTEERFGPVRKLAANEDACLIVTLCCRAIEPAKRRKAGLVLVGAKLAGIVNNSSTSDVSTLDDLAVLALL